MARFTTLYSGSSGNCAVVEEDGAYLLLDMGGSCRATVRALESLGLPLSGLRGILITHEHVDHVRGLAVFLKRTQVPLLGTCATLDALWNGELIPEDALMVDMEAQLVDLGGFLIKAFPTSHDAAGSCGYRVTTPGGAVMALATDLGKMTAEVFVHLEGAALVALEANYDPYMLRTGPYPAVLKSRIAGVRGHLSNGDAAAAAVQLIAGGCRRLTFCHLSEENNRPDCVHQAVREAMHESGLALPEGCTVRVASRYDMDDWLEF